jgi:hypothetical protein
MTKKIKKMAAKGSASHENFGSKYPKIFVIIQPNNFNNLGADAIFKTSALIFITV